MGGRLTWRGWPLAAVVGTSLLLASSASAAPSPTQTAAHDPAKNTVSGFAEPSRDEPDEQPQPGDTPEQAVARQFPDNMIETFRFQIAPGEENSSFSVSVAWPDPDADLDVFVYRIRGNGTIVPDPLTSAASLDDPEVA